MVAMSLLDDVMNDLKQAMKDKDTVALNTLRSIKSAVEYKKAEAGKDPEEGEILQVIQKEAKKRKDSIAQFRQGNREDLAEKEEAELKIIEKYLPAEMSDAELEEIVKKVIADVGAGSKKEIGKVMSQLMPLVRGRADGKRVNQAVGKLLD
ncbi:MAG TPA: GatB/YqeY domain-containing protein [bacterium]|nr:GatB/YqeY domain-containing protein [bacterium]